MSLADGATSNHAVFLAPDHPLQKCASLYLDSPHQLTAKLCDLLLGNWLICGCCLQTQRWELNLQTSEESGAEKMWRWERVQHSEVVTCAHDTVKEPHCRVIIIIFIFFCKWWFCEHILSQYFQKRCAFCFIYFHSDMELTETVRMPALPPSPSHKSLTWLSADIYRWRGRQGTAKCWDKALHLSTTACRCHHHQPFL